MFLPSANFLRRKCSAWVALAIFCGQLMLAPVQAANVVWNTPQTMTADTNVRTYGSLVGAFDIASTETTTTVNGVSFAGTLAGSPPTFGSVAALAPVAGTDYLGVASWGPPNSPTLSSNYATLNDSAAVGFGGSGQMTLTLTSLTPGRSYMLQTWVGDTRGAAAARRQTLTGGALTSGTMLFNSTGADGGNGSFVVGNFVADSTSQTVTITGSPDAVPMLNAFQLRDVTNVTTAVNWSPAQTMIADTDVRTDGTLVGAYTTGNSNNATTVNGVPFSWGGNPDGAQSATFGSVATALPLATGGGTWTFAAVGGGALGSPASPPLSADYAKLAEGAIFGIASSPPGLGGVALTLTNLTPGEKYLFQTWVADSRGAASFRTQTLSAGGSTSGVMPFNNSGGANGGNGSFVVGSFVATTDAMTINYNPGADIGMMNAFQLRSLGVSRSYTWTATGATPLADGGGTWNAADTNWSSGTSVGTWGDATSDVAVFGVGNGAAGTVTVGSVALNGITFNAAGSGNYTLSSGTLALGGTIPTIQTNAAGTSTIASVISGAAGLIKSGTGTLALTGANTYSGATTIEAGTVRVGHASALGGSSNALNVTGGTLDLDGTSLSVGRLSGLAGTVITTNAAAGTATLSTTVASGSSTFAGTIQDNGAGVVALTKTGAGQLTLTAANTYTGTTTVNNGTLYFGDGVGVGTTSVIRGPLTINAGGTASLGTWSLGYLGATSRVTSIAINGGVLNVREANGFYTLGAPDTVTMTGGTISGAAPAMLYTQGGPGYNPLFTIVASPTTATISSGLDLRLGTDSNVVRFDVGAGTTPSGVDLLVSGPIIRSAISAAGGGLTKSGAGLMRLTAANTYTGATTVSAGRLEIAPGGSINDSSGVTLNGATAELKYNSGTALTAPITFTQGTISGTGAIGTAVTAGSGDTLSPGNSPGIQPYTAGLAWNPDGTYAWELNALTGAAGTNWDRLDVTGGLNLSGLSAESKFNLNLITLTSGNVAGPLGSPYVAGSSYQFTIATFDTLSVPGAFSNAAGSDLTSLFAISLSGWQGTQPALADISVKVNQAGTGIDLVVVPEPGALALAAVGIAAAAWIRRRSDKKPGAEATGA
ncbi:MAG: beta strand repeat-containing protein [Planctomycetia bacterium]